MTTLWIVHRDPLLRSALVRAAGAPESAVCGAPGDPIFATSPLADVVLLGLAEISKPSWNSLTKQRLAHPKHAGSWCPITAWLTQLENYSTESTPRS